MGYQVVRQPDGRLAAWSTSADCFVLVDATADELVEHFARKAEAAAALEVQEKVGAIQRQVAAVVEGEPAVYGQPPRTWEQLVEEQRMRHGRSCDCDSCGLMAPPPPPD